MSALPKVYPPIACSTPQINPLHIIYVVLSRLFTPPLPRSLLKGTGILTLIYLLRYYILVPMKCLNCDTEFPPKTKRAKFCSDKCRVEFHRNNTASVTESSVTQPSVTETDQLFEAKIPGYYKFGDEVYARTCIAVMGPPDKRVGCSKSFKTRLQLLRFCSPEHMQETLSLLGGKYAK